MAEVTESLSTPLADRYRIERRLGAGGMATEAEEVTARTAVVSLGLSGEVARQRTGGIVRPPASRRALP